MVKDHKSEIVEKQTIDRRSFRKRMRKDKRFRSMILTFLMEYLIKEVNRDHVTSKSNSDSSESEISESDNLQKIVVSSIPKTSAYDFHSENYQDLLNASRNTESSVAHASTSVAKHSVSRFCFFDLPDFLFESQCYFTKHEVVEIANRLFTSETVPCVEESEDHEEIHRHDALALLLARLKQNQPVSNLSELANRGWNDTFTRRVVTSLFSRLYRKFQCMLFWDYKRLTSNRLEIFAHALEGISGRDCLIGFIECYFRPMRCQPIDDEDVTSISREPSKEARFSNKNLFYQVIFTPDGLISSLFGPACWKLPSHLLEVKSKMYMLINDAFKGMDGRQLKYYCDRFTYFSKATETDFRSSQSLPNEPLTDSQKTTNSKMSILRGKIEQRAKSILHEFKYLSTVQNDKNEDYESLSNIYATAMLLTNCKLCLDQHKGDGEPFVSPPTLDEYLRNAVGLEKSYKYEDCLFDIEELGEEFTQFE